MLGKLIMEIMDHFLFVLPLIVLERTVRKMDEEDVMERVSFLILRGAGKTILILKKQYPF